MNYLGLIILGVVLVFGVPAGVGLALAHRFDTATGIIGGVVIFVIIVAIGYRHMMKKEGGKAK